MAAPAPLTTTGEAKGGEKGEEKAYPVLSRREVEALIAEGRQVIIVNQHVLKVDAWVKYHPGGDKSIAHMVGRDATDEVTVLHSPETRQMMNRYRIGRIVGRWVNFLPPIQGGKFRLASEAGCDDAADVCPRDDEACRADEACHAASSPSGSSSRSPSPVFDAAPKASDGTGLHCRRGGAGPPATRSGSVTSSSSLGGDDVPFDGMTYLDTVTKEEIRLDLDLYPPLDGATQEVIVQKYRLLDARIKAEGLYDCRYSSYAIECLRYTLFFALFVVFLRWGWYASSAFFLGLLWHQLAFTVHDAGHIGITHNYHVDSVIGIIVADFCGGLSLGWWKRNHNVHHIVTNAPEHDPDIEHLPFFAVSHRFIGSLRSTYYERVMPFDAAARFFIWAQAYLYYIILLFGRFNLCRLSWEYLLLGQAPKKGPAWWHWHLEVAGQIFFWTWFGYGVMYKCIPTAGSRLVFLIISHWVTSPLHCQITLSHFAMSTADLGPDESFPQKMLRTTMDVDCPQWLDFIHGGLQFQAIHHLFPRIPRHNLRRTQRLVQEYCDDVGIPYGLYGFVGGNQKVIGKLAEVSRQAAIFAKCQRTIVQTDDPLDAHHH